MAATVYTDIAAALATLFEDTAARTINRSCPLIQVIQHKEADGKNISWPVVTGTAVPAGAPIADGADVSTYNSDTKRQATLDYTTYHDAFQISGRALAAARKTGNPADFANMMAEELMESAERLGVAVGQHLYTGTGSSNQILGLRATAGGLKSTGTYAGIDRLTVTQFRCNELLNGGTPRALTLELMREMRKNIYVASGRKSDLIVTSPTQHTNYGNLLGAQRRYVQDVNIRGQQIKLDGGFQVLEFDGIPVIEDQFCPAGEMLFLNTSDIFLRFLPGDDAANGSAELKVSPEEQFGSSATRMRAKILPLALTGDAPKFALYIYPQVQVRNPIRHGVLGDLS